jgi:hypothetical protein
MRGPEAAATVSHEINKILADAVFIRRGVPEAYGGTYSDIGHQCIVPDCSFSPTSLRADTFHNRI